MSKQLSRLAEKMHKKQLVMIVISRHIVKKKEKISYQVSELATIKMTQKL